MKTHLIKIALLSLGLTFLCSAMTGCTPRTEVKVSKVKKTSDLKSRQTTIDRSSFDTSADGWKPVQESDQNILPRNPFRGFSDIAMAEALMRMQALEEQSSDLQLPEQLYSTRDYRVVGVITGTADPKVYVIDPAGNRFILRRGSLLGNNNGSISSIRREGIEVYERVADKGQYIELPLFEEKNNDQNNIQLRLQ
ncbi:MAG: pilus assembly protein PilP [Proteobacteria bacterium]|nr:pilus assembly protein PilP [Pseudomonadota bacterium]